VDQQLVEHLREDTMRKRITLSGGILAVGLAGCGSEPEAQPPQAALTSVEAVAFPCRTGPCPPGQPCPPPPSCDPQYEVSALLRLASKDGVAVTSFRADLYDVQSTLVGPPQAWSVPAVPFSVAPAGTDLPLSFLTHNGADVRGGSVRVTLAGTDVRGARWDLTVGAPVPR
jgi:hypothetical protein